MVILAPILFNSSVYWKRESQILSFIILVPEDIAKHTPICDWRSVGNPGYGKVFTVALDVLFDHQTRTWSPFASTFPPISRIFAITGSKCFVIQL